MRAISSAKSKSCICCCVLDMRAISSVKSKSEWLRFHRRYSPHLQYTTTTGWLRFHRRYSPHIQYTTTNAWLRFRRSIGFRFFFLQLTLSWCSQLPGGREREITSSLVLFLSWHQNFQLVFLCWIEYFLQDYWRM
jgi:hypothetical protein